MALCSHCTISLVLTQVFYCNLVPLQTGASISHKRRRQEEKEEGETTREEKEVCVDGNDVVGVTQDMKVVCEYCSAEVGQFCARTKSFCLTEVLPSDP